MEQYFTPDYTGAPFALFAPPHLAALAIIALVCLSFLYFRNVWGDRERKIARYTLAAFIFLVESSWHAWSVYYGKWNIQQNLPLHLCSIFIWGSIFMLITRNYPFYELAYFLGLGGAIQAVLTPDAGIYGFPHFRAFQTVADHGALIAAVMYMTWVEGYRPTLHSFKRMFVWANLYMGFVFGINLLIGSNYMFIARKPDFPTLIDMLAPWPWYILQLELIGFTIAAVLYLPYAITDWRTRSRPAAAQ